MAVTCSEFHLVWTYCTNYDQWPSAQWPIKFLDMSGVLETVKISNKNDMLLKWLKDLSV